MVQKVRMARGRSGNMGPNPSECAASAASGRRLPDSVWVAIAVCGFAIWWVHDALAVARGVHRERAAALGRAEAQFVAVREGRVRVPSDVDPGRGLGLFSDLEIALRTDEFGMHVVLAKQGQRR